MPDWTPDMNLETRATITVFAREGEDWKGEDWKVDELYTLLRRGADTLDVHVSIAETSRELNRV